VRMHIGHEESRYFTRLQEIQLKFCDHLMKVGAKKKCGVRGGAPILEEEA
jgi:hypothetical protein